MIKYMAICLLVFVPMSAFAAQGYDQPIHTGEPYSCGNTSPTQELECRIFNLLNDKLGQIIVQLQNQNGNLTMEVSNQATIISKQQQEINILNSIVANTTPVTNSVIPEHMSGQIPSNTTSGTIITDPLGGPPCRMTATGVRC